jgi:hypothetical protein
VRAGEYSGAFRVPLARMLRIVERFPVEFNSIHRDTLRSVPLAFLHHPSRRTRLPRRRRRRPVLGARARAAELARRDHRTAAQGELGRCPRLRLVDPAFSFTSPTGVARRRLEEFPLSVRAQFGDQRVAGSRLTSCLDQLPRGVPIRLRATPTRSGLSVTFTWPR